MVKFNVANIVKREVSFGFCDHEKQVLKTICHNSSYITRCDQTELQTFIRNYANFTVNLKNKLPFIFYLT